MSSWREQILKEFTPDVSPLTLVADPDGLVLEEGIMEDIRARGFVLIFFDDSVAFRYEYESKVRSRWDQGEHINLIVVLKSDENELASLPYDLIQVGRKLHFSLSDIFPNLSYSVISALDRGDFNTLFEAQKRYAPGQLGENATNEFILRHVFEIAPEIIKGPSDLLRVLLRRHYIGQRLPAILDERFIELLRNNSSFDYWPLELIISDREAFITFLQERWTVFLDRKVVGENTFARDGQASYSMTVEGIIDLPFDHHDVRVYIDNMFIEGLLKPVTHEQAYDISKTWCGIGVITDPSTDWIQRISKLVDRLQNLVPEEDARHNDWLHFAHIWAEFIVLRHRYQESVSEHISESIYELQFKVDYFFLEWVSRRFSGLINLPPNPPVMLHQLPRFLSRKIELNKESKIAMVVVDGLSMDQWLIIQDVLKLKQPNYFIRENALFAWIPTLTSVSRQAAFSGKAPSLFPDSINTTDKESTLWSQFWVNQGLSLPEVLYMRGLGECSLENLAETLSHPQIRVVGLVIDKLDKIMHGIELGMAGMHNQVRQWAQQAYLMELLTMLFDENYCVFITSDHGNIEAEGFGKLDEGVLADTRGQRVRVYNNHLLRSKAKANFVEAIEWSTIGLPSDYLPLIAGNRFAFIAEGKHIVSHGGLCIEELIVPLIQIERKYT